MKNILFVFIGFILLTPLSGFTQNFRLGVSAGMVADMDWAKPLEDVFMTLPYNFGLKTGTPIHLGLVVDYKPDKKLFFTTGVSILSRRIEFSDNHLYTNNIFYNTFEIPLLLNLQKELAENVKIIGFAGASFDYVANQYSGDSFVKQTPYYEDQELFQSGHRFSVVHNVSTIAAIGGIGIENSLGRAGILRTNLKYHYQLSPLHAYEAEWYGERSTGLFNHQQQSRFFRASYAAINFIYYPPF